MNYENKIKLLEDKVSLLEDKVSLLIDGLIKNQPLSVWALGLGYDNEKIVQIFKIMEKYWNLPCENYNFNDIERDFNSIGIDYQILKSLLRVFYDQHQYLKVIRNYLNTNYKQLGNVSIEYIDMYNNLCGKG